MDEKDIIEALRPVRDPEIGMSIVDLNMVRGVRIEGEKVYVEIALTVQGCPLQKTIESDVRNIIMRQPGVKEVELKLGVMTRDEQFRLSEELRKMRKQSKPEGATEVAPGIFRYGKMNIQHVVAIVSGKGGVGKSLITGLIASELRKEGFSVGILDADITGPSMAKIMGVSGRAAATEKTLIPSRTREGIKLISMNLILEKQTQAVVWRGPLVTRAINQLYSQTEWGNLHFLLLDLPPGTSDAQLTVFQSIPLDGIVVVSTPQSLAHMIVEKALDMARVTKIPVLGLVENMSYIKCPHCGKKIEMYPNDAGVETEMLSRLKILGRMPFDPSVARLADTGKLETYESAEVREIVAGIRESLLSISPVSTEPLAWKGEEIAGRTG
ncbi:MAG: P-loop NTPase [Thermoplasmata archaeon]|uniref:Iron-sulfur cluster carrier protein n=1 Tax=Candidatus Sysuiplasma superficiale TaxID=2823368 RepID=A0A8J7YP10_9ARCH|nr:Mrp/NBP35 family ATP-binding protein [Candidatus Sysuiplasma superficiale]MBX8644253.1 P-loop NTPase [Candidatus Sysuiplasma superficiale]MCL4347351.1 Mrp/NBP35 family ATP-binding protein [Candidatus Thermoplasmatota archaeon]MCL5437312.1 Mrp/NBP35 family ATP-binding protein [Candidatus Thermoplasmatota archaeon]